MQMPDAASHSPLVPPSRADVLWSILSPLLAALIVSAAVGIGPLTAVAAMVATVGAAMVGDGYCLALNTRLDRSPLRGDLDVLLAPSESRLNRWYLPLVAAAGAGALVQAMQTGVSLWRAGILGHVGLLLVAAGLGAVEGALVALSLAAGWGLGCALLRRRYSRAT